MKLFLVAAAVTIATGIVSQAAHAQPYPGPYHPYPGYSAPAHPRYVPPPRYDEPGPRRGYDHDGINLRELAQALRARGFDQIELLDDSGRVYRVKASRWRSIYLIAIDARTGEIIRQTRISRGGDDRGPGWGERDRSPSYGGQGDDDQSEPGPDRDWRDRRNPH